MTSDGVHKATTELVGAIRASAWMMAVLHATRAAGLPQSWVGGGVLRDLVWDDRADGFDPARVKDVDVAFFDPADLSSQRDRAAEEALAKSMPTVNWDAKNQAAVHTWYPHRFGLEVAALSSAADGVATWPETATSVAARLDVHGEIAVTCVEGGVEDLIAGVHRRNPRRVSIAEYERRLASRDITRRWPQVHVIPG